MFEDKLQKLFSEIFDIQKVSFDEPPDSAIEQETLFVTIERAPGKARHGKYIARVEGEAFIMAPSDKIPFGYFTKRIENAPSELTAPFFFYEIEENTKRYRNLVQRAFSFVYFFQDQYDPKVGKMLDVEFSEEVTS